MNPDPPAECFFGSAMHSISDTIEYLNSYRDASPLKGSDKRDQNCPDVRKFWQEDEAAAKTVQSRTSRPPIAPDHTPVVRSSPRWAWQAGHETAMPDLTKSWHSPDIRIRKSVRFYLIARSRTGSIFAPPIRTRSNSWRELVNPGWRPFNRGHSIEAIHPASAGIILTYGSAIPAGAFRRENRCLTYRPHAS